MIFVDTSAWITVMDRRENNHARANAYYHELVATRARMFTSNYVLAETFTRIRYDRGLREMLFFRATIERAEKFGQLEILWINRAHETAAWHILEKYDDQNFSFVDATSFALMREQTIARAFAFDDNFSIMGFDVNP